MKNPAMQAECIPLDRPATVLLLILAISAVSWSQRCDWTRPEVGATRYIQCLDLRQNDGDTIDVPSTVTRIGKDGLSLCMSDITQYGNADVVYLLEIRHQ